MSIQRSGHRRRLSGFVQIVVLGGLVTVAALLTAVLSGSKQTSENERGVERLSVGALVAESGIRRLIAAIEDPRDDLEVLVGVGGAPYSFVLNDNEFTLAIEGEAGKIDLLSADRRILIGYAQDMPLEEREQQALIAALDEARAHEDGEAARHALYAHGLSALSSKILAQDFTLLSGLVGIDPLLASERVLRSLPDISDAAATEIVRLRLEGSPGLANRSRFFTQGMPQFTLVARVNWTQVEVTTKRVPVEITTSGRVRTLTGFR